MNPDSIPTDPVISPSRAFTNLVVVIVAVAALATGAVLLPHSRYVRFQQFAEGDVTRLRWVYERIHFDPTPIDVGVIGSSRVEAAVSAPKLGKALSAQIGAPVHVANLAVPLEGRDMHFVVAQELFKSRPEARLLILSLVEPIRRSHPAFRNVGDVSDVLNAPFWINYYWLDNVAYLPYRQMSLFLQTQFPKFFGVDLQFDPTHYRGTNFDTTQTFRLENGKVVDRDALPDRAKLEAGASPHGRSKGSVLARVTGGDENVIEDTLTARLAQEAAHTCRRVVLLHLPTYHGSPNDADLATNSRSAAVLQTPPEIGVDWTEFSDPGHLRRSGIDKVSAWLPTALSPYLETLHRPPSC